MERTLIAINLPNTITIGLMAIAWFLAIALAKRVFIGNGPTQAAGTGGF
jgi:hypothetical protein